MGGTPPLRSYDNLWDSGIGSGHVFTHSLGPLVFDNFPKGNTKGKSAGGGKSLEIISFSLGIHKGKSVGYPPSSEIKVKLDVCCNPN